MFEVFKIGFTSFIADFKIDLSLVTVLIKGLTVGSNLRLFLIGVTGFYSDFIQFSDSITD
jgi:hypothetical protein